VPQPLHTIAAEAIARGARLWIAAHSHPAARTCRAR
jgi:hypothetical protein